MIDPPHREYTVPQLHKATHVPRGVILAAIHSGQLTAKHNQAQFPGRGGRYRVLGSNFLRWLDGCRYQPSFVPPPARPGSLSNREWFKKTCAEMGIGQ